MVLNPSILDEIVHSAVLKVKESKVFSASMRNEFNSYTFEQLEEGKTEFTELKNIYEGFMKNGDAEKCYGKYYAKIPLNSTRFFKGLSRNSATLVSTKVADCMLAYCKREKSSTDSTEDYCCIIREREGWPSVCRWICITQPLQQAQNKKFSWKAMTILKAGKLETSGHSQKLISSLNRGGLWSITEPAQKIFLKTEHCFRQFTSKAGLQRDDIVGITHRQLVIVMFYLTTLWSCLMLNWYQSCVSKDLMHSIVSLYVRVRSFSFAKDFIQRHKIKAKQAKTKSLRKEISRRCQEEQQTRDEQGEQFFY